MKKSKLEKMFNKVLSILPNKMANKYQKLFYQIFKFVIVGFMATLIDFIILIILKECFSINTIIANTISFAISTIYNYIASVLWVFDVDSKKNSKLNFLLFVVFSVIGLIINNIILSICVDKLNIYYIFSKVLATVVVMIFNFITRKLFLE